MATFYTSDTHFSHARILEYSSRLFVSIEAHDEELVRRWNDRVKPRDLVYHLGDFALGPSGTAARWRARLNGRILLVLGNHDRSRSHMIAAGFDVVVKDLVAVVGDVMVLMTHRPPKGEPQDLVGLTVLHGHVHQTYARRGRLINVGVDVRGYAPATFEELLATPDEALTAVPAPGTVGT